MLFKKTISAYAENGKKLKITLCKHSVNGC
jgi:hypothetical protein